jgi:DNA repair photolyase
MKALSKRFGKRKGTIMFPTLHDITPSNLSACAVFLERLLAAGNDVLVVSKPHLECIEFLCRAFTLYKDQILFRFTIGSASDYELQKWEPGAPNFEERIAALKCAFSMGYKTSVSCEPMLDENIEDVVINAEDYVTDAIWLGKANKLIERLTANGASEEVLQHGRGLVNIQNDEAIKKLYEFYKNHPKIKWKESIKAVVGLEIPTKKGLDV